MTHLLLAWFFLQAPDPAALSQQGKAALAAGRYDDAIRAYNGVLASLPGHPGILLNLCLAHHLAGHHAQALQNCTQALAKEPTLVPALLIQGVSELKLGHPEKALAPLQRYHTAQPDQPTGVLELADTYLLLQRPAEALPLFDQLTRLAPADPRSWHGLGRAHVAVSEQIFNRLPPNSPARSALLGRAKLEQQRFRAAYSLFRQTLTANPQFPGAHTAIAHIYRQTGHADWAETEARLETGGLPTGPYAEALTHEGGAMQAFDRLANLPVSPELLELQAEAALRQGKAAEAVAFFRKALALRPVDARIEQQLAHSLLQNRDYDEAIRLLRRHAMQYELGQALLESGDAAAAIGPLTAALKQQAARLEIRGALGRALLAADQPAQALPHLQAARAQDPDGVVHFQLSRAYQRLGQPQPSAAALAEYQKRQKAAEPPPEAEITAPR